MLNLKRLSSFNFTVGLIIINLLLMSLFLYFLVIYFPFKFIYCNFIDYNVKNCEFVNFSPTLFFIFLLTSFLCFSTVLTHTYIQLHVFNMTALVLFAAIWPNYVKRVHGVMVCGIAVYFWCGFAYFSQLV